MEDVTHQLLSPLEQSRRGERTLSRLHRDHKRASACIEILQQRIATDQPASCDISWLNSLVDQFIDSPDDYHHCIERKAFRRLRCRLGRVFPRHLDLDNRHEKLGRRRMEVIRDRDENEVEYLTEPTSRSALSSFCDCIRSQIEFEESQLFPLFKRHLKCEDWIALRDETEAYDAVLLSFKELATQDSEF